ncbi:hypothetical protein ACFQS7_22180 [Dankookia sp. GCM10030260]|uniref:hypothetical protein n=1 Tax=Dankookia sp. GCM10030260 TaxID=3273390 RepID=UPI00361974EB
MATLHQAPHDFRIGIRRRLYVRPGPPHAACSGNLPTIRTVLGGQAIRFLRLRQSSLPLLVNSTGFFLI